MFAFEDGVYIKVVVNGRDHGICAKSGIDIEIKPFDMVRRLKVELKVEL